MDQPAVLLLQLAIVYEVQSEAEEKRMKREMEASKRVKR